MCIFLVNTNISLDFRKIWCTWDANLTIPFLVKWIQLKFTKLKAFHETHFSVGSKTYTNFHICVFSLANLKISLYLHKIRWIYDANLTVPFLVTWTHLKFTKLTAFHETYFSVESKIYTNCHICVFFWWANLEIK